MRRSHLTDVRTWHVFSRGARRLALFYEDADYRQFLEFLREALILSGCLLFAYVLMGNHYHLMLRGTGAQITDCMRRLNWRYAMYHNDRHRMGGHVFDGRYRRYPQRSLMWMLWRLAYIFLNPVKADLVGKAEDYRWSGFLSFMGLQGSPLEVDPLPEMADVSKSLPEARAYFAELMREQRERGQSRGSTTPTAREIQLDQFEWVRRQAEARARTVKEVDKDTLALWWGRDMGVPPQIMRRALGLETSDIVRYRVNKLQARLDADQALARRLVL